MPALEQFLKSLSRSGLLDRNELWSALRDLPDEYRTEPDKVAAHLVSGGLLTQFQARKLLEGRSLGLVLGPFQVLAPIGRGGMGCVYLVRDCRNRQLLALKVLPPKRAREEERLLARFRREMELGQLVAHPHLAKTCEVGVADDVYFIAMEYIPGRNLHRLVSDDGPIPVPRLARLAAEVAAGLEHAHGRGLIHRDLKPSNIIITPNDHAKVLDLGLAIVADDRTGDRTVVGGQGFVVGTMDYLAPEQAVDSLAVDARADLYSLGCTLYYAVTGQPPFPGGTTKAKLRQHRTEAPVPVVWLNPSVPAPFIALIDKLMSKKPEDRYPSAAAVRVELLKWADPAPALPLDTAADAGYRDALTKLQSAEPPSSPSELVWESMALPADRKPYFAGRGRLARFLRAKVRRNVTALRQWLRDQPLWLVLTVLGFGTLVFWVGVGVVLTWLWW